MFCMTITPPVIINYVVVGYPGLTPGSQNSRERGRICVYGFLTFFWCFFDGLAKQ